MTPAQDPTLATLFTAPMIMGGRHEELTRARWCLVSVFFFLNARPALGAGETVATLATSHTVLPSLGGDISDIHYQVSQQRGPGTL